MTEKLISFPGGKNNIPTDTKFPENWYRFTRRDSSIFDGLGIFTILGTVALLIKEDWTILYAVPMDRLEDVEMFATAEEYENAKEFYLRGNDPGDETPEE